MDASAPEAATASPRSHPQPRSAHQQKTPLHDTKPQPASSQRKQKPQTTRSKSTPKSSAQDAAADASLGDFRASTWFQAGEGDLVFAQWLLGRCNGVGDAATPQSLDATKRMFALFKTQRKLRQELALGSKTEVTSVEEEEGEEDGEEREEEPLWPVEEIVEKVGDVLRVSRLELLKEEKTVEGALERIVVAEVVDNATELILSRASSEHEPLLRRWVAVLQEKTVEQVETEEKVPEVSPEVDEEDAEAAAHTKTKKKAKKEKKMRVKKNKSKVAEDTACEQVESFLTFLTESAQTQTHVDVSMTATSSDAERVWTTELQRIVELSSIEPEEEARRLRVAHDIQTVLRREVSKWRHCEVILFGSSLSRYGSRDSDLDMCLLPTGRGVGKDLAPPKEVVGSRQLRHLMNGKVGEGVHAPSTDEESAEQLRELRAQVQKSLEKLTQSLNTLDRSGKIGDKHTKQRRQLEFFDTQMRLLRNAIMEELTKLLGVTESQNGNSTAKSARLKTVIAASRRRSDDLYLLRAILQRAAKCEVRHVIAGARVPIIRFLHTRSGPKYECDLCFENVLATRNTPLLRAYASFDDRARALGLAVKHWAKERRISDASMGFLSSYSFVLLSIYYLQVVHVLPNLQDSRLLESAHIRPEYYNDINIAFCENHGLAQAYHKRTTAGIDAANMPLTTLLIGFFEFYATQFDFAKRVVTVRSPETAAQKIAHWGGRKAKTWRMSIQDPLETGRDLGCVLQFKGQERILREFRRAHEMLARGESFSDEVCAGEKPAVKSGKPGAKAKQSPAKQANGGTETVSADQSKPKQQQVDKLKRSYIVTMQSADEELTKEAIENLFKAFHKSFCVGKVVEASARSDADGGTENTNKQWEVELLTQAQNCPRTLSLRTRIDWKAADGRVGRVWLHHQAMFSTPPCQKCLSPEHPTGKCPPGDADEGDDGEGAGASDRGEPRIEHNVAQRNIRRHVLRLTLGGVHGNAASKKNGRRKKQQLHGASQDDHPDDKSRTNSKRNTNGKPASSKKEPRGDNSSTGSTVRHVEVVEVVTAPTASRIEGDVDNANKTHQKKKKWQQRVHRKRGGSKADSNNAAV
ncbi:hypothetical protein PRNP1_008137 [Phytophthora ramorum]